MARAIERLNSLSVTRAKAPGLYPDGRGLYLRVGKSAGDSERVEAPAGPKSWVFRFMLNGRARYMGLGSLETVTLAEARDRRDGARKGLKNEGIDPIEAKREVKARARLEKAKAVTFKEAASRYIKAHGPGWKNPKHAAQWTSTLEAYVFPVIGDQPVQAVDTALVTQILEPIWTEKNETASRVRGRIEAVLDWARARGYREGENPARWRGHLDHLLVDRSRLARGHHAALPYAELGDFTALLRAREGFSARALEFTILTAARTSEALGARWEEIDFQARLWTVPADRMKAKRDHRVPLSAAALAVLKPLHEVCSSDYVFPGGKPGKSLSNMALLETLRRMERGDLTAHGFRSTFRDWAAERTSYPRDVAEMALAHTIADKVEAAYRRGDLFEKRRGLMDAWGAFSKLPSLKASGGVVSMRRA
ncbi:MAG TPA: tyrosine-type recombinase/integrase [Caulobacteraceae bacterium]